MGLFEHSGPVAAAGELMGEPNTAPWPGRRSASLPGSVQEPGRLPAATATRPASSVAKAHADDLGLQEVGLDPGLECIQGGDARYQGDHHLLAGLRQVSSPPPPGSILRRAVTSRPPADVALVLIGEPPYAGRSATAMPRPCARPRIRP